MQRLIGAFSAVIVRRGDRHDRFLPMKNLPAERTRRQAILALLTQLETGFDAGDAKGLANCWTENGEFVGPVGGQGHGREDIEKLFPGGVRRSQGGQ